MTRVVIRKAECIVNRGYRHSDGIVHKGYMFERYDRIFILIDTPNCKYIPKGKQHGRHQTSKETHYFYTRCNGRKMTVKLIGYNPDAYSTIEDRNGFLQKVNIQSIDDIASSFTAYINKYPLCFKETKYGI